jgi:hypothetical protein
MAIAPAPEGVAKATMVSCGIMFLIYYAKINQS